MVHHRFHRWRSVVLGLLIAFGIMFGPLQQRLAQWWYEREKPIALPAAVRVDQPDNQTTSEPVSESAGQPANVTNAESPATNYQLPTTSYQLLQFRQN